MTTFTFPDELLSQHLAIVGKSAGFPVVVFGGAHAEDKTCRANDILFPERQ